MPLPIEAVCYLVMQCAWECTASSVNEMTCVCSESLHPDTPYSYGAPSGMHSEPPFGVRGEPFTPPPHPQTTYGHKAVHSFNFNLQKFLLLTSESAGDYFLRSQKTSITP